MKDLEIYNDVDELISALADTICEASKVAITSHDQFNFVLSGGSSPQKLYQLLASEAYKNKINWEKTYFFFGDERFVPENDAQRNSLMAKKALFEPLNVPKSHIFQVDTSDSPEAAAQAYIKNITAHFKQRPIQFDFILLGLGDDAHTASLFPESSVLEENEATIKSVFVNQADMYRITMTAPLINQAKQVAFLVFGEKKAEAVYQVLEDKTGSIKKIPARLINPDHKKLHWFIDSAAASLL